ncbi:MAG TPA: phenylalanine--tRNA ligase beta subunit-related protein [Patescibacteria group bacterium]|nr:phenylalanine--tRNA ligase beta subunit-related protein [Patescibacteria group bacterium]
MIHMSAAIGYHYPQTRIGIMRIAAISKPDDTKALEEKKRQLEGSLRQQYADRELRRGLPAVGHYIRYYKQFGKQYHVLMQLDSLVDKGRNIPTREPLVEAMFMAELKNQLLTAGHDAKRLNGVLSVELSGGEEAYQLLSGKQQQLKAGDILMRDESAVIGSILYGPDHRTRITATTRDCLFVVYAPYDIGETAIQEHFADIAAYVELFSPGAQVKEQKICG